MSYEKVIPQGKILLLAACGSMAVGLAKTDSFMADKAPLFVYDKEVSKTEPVAMNSDAAVATVSFAVAAAALYGLGRKEDENDNRPVIKRMMDRVRDR